MTRRYLCVGAVLVAAWLLMPAAAVGSAVKSCGGTPSGISQSNSGAISGCVQIGPFASGAYMASLQTRLNLEGPDWYAKLPPAKRRLYTQVTPVRLTLSPQAGPPGTVVTVTVRLKTPHVPAKLGVDGDPQVAWAGSPAGLMLSHGPLRWSSGDRSFTMRVTVPLVPWIEVDNAARVEGLSSGDYPISAYCINSSGGCAIGRPNGTAMFHLEVAHPPSWCRSAGSCASLTVSPSDAPAGAVVRISGYAPLIQFDDGSSSFLGNFELTHGRHSGPQMQITAPAGGAITAFTGRTAFEVTPSPSFASLTNTRPLIEVTDGNTQIAADPDDQRIVAWCGAGTIGLSVNGALSTISTAGVGAVLTDEGFDGVSVDQPPSCDDVMPLSRATVAASFRVGIAPFGAPPLYEVALETSDGGRTWTPLPAPAGTRQSGFGGFHGEVAVFATLAKQQPSSGPPWYSPNGIVSETTTDGGASWHEGGFSCPAAGPCVTFGPLQPGNCSMGFATEQEPLFSTDAGARWRAAPTVGYFSACAEGELYATGPDTELLIDSISPYLLQRSNDGGASWEDVSLPQPPGAQTPYDGLGPAPGGVTLLPSGGLLVTGTYGSTSREDSAGWGLLRPGARSWCVVAGWKKSWQFTDQVSTLTVIGDDIWWLVGVKDGDQIRHIPLSRIACARF